MFAALEAGDTKGTFSAGEVKKTPAVGTRTPPEDHSMNGNIYQ